MGVMPECVSQSHASGHILVIFCSCHDALLYSRKDKIRYVNQGVR
jgi:hypothetical protein